MNEVIVIKNGIEYTFRVLNGNNKEDNKVINYYNSIEGSGFRPLLKDPITMYNGWLYVSPESWMFSDLLEHKLGIELESRSKLMDLFVVDCKFPTNPGEPFHPILNGINNHIWRLYMILEGIKKNYSTPDKSEPEVVPDNTLFDYPFTFTQICGNQLTEKEIKNMIVGYSASGLIGAHSLLKQLKYNIYNTLEDGLIIMVREVRNAKTTYFRVNKDSKVDDRILR